MNPRRSLSLALTIALLLPTGVAAAEPDGSLIFAPEPPPVPAITVQAAARDLGTAFRAGQQITRAEFIAAVMDRLAPQISETCFPRLSPSAYWLLFSDVPKDATYGRELCMALRGGYVQGNPDGTFRPNAPINVAEASKILTKMFGIAVDASDPSMVWYAPYVKAMQSAGALPSSVTKASLAMPVTSEKLSTMLDALIRNV